MRKFIRRPINNETAILSMVDPLRQYLIEDSDERMVFSLPPHIHLNLVDNQEQLLKMFEHVVVYFSSEDGSNIKVECIKHNRKYNHMIDY